MSSSYPSGWATREPMTWDVIRQPLVGIALAVIALAILGLFGLDGVGVVALALIGLWSIGTLTGRSISRVVRRLVPRWTGRHPTPD